MRFTPSCLPVYAVAKRRSYSVPNQKLPKKSAEPRSVQNFSIFSPPAEQREEKENVVSVDQALAVVALFAAGAIYIDPEIDSQSVILVDKLEKEVALLRRDIKSAGAQSTDKRFGLRDQIVNLCLTNLGGEGQEGAEYMDMRR